MYVTCAFANFSPIAILLTIEYCLITLCVAVAAILWEGYAIELKLVGILEDLWVCFAVSFYDFLILPEFFFQSLIPSVVWFFLWSSFFNFLVGLLWVRNLSRGGGGFLVVICILSWTVAVGGWEREKEGWRWGKGVGGRGWRDEKFSFWSLEKFHFGPCADWAYN